MKKLALLAMVLAIAAVVISACTDAGDPNHPPVPASIDLEVTNNNPAYTNIKIKGAFNGWVPAISGRNGDVWFLTVITETLDAGDYEWGVIEDDGSDNGIWLLPAGPNLVLTIAADGTATGDAAFEIPMPTGTVDITFEVDMNAETVSVHLAGGFGGDGYSDWAPGADDMLMDDGDADGVYSLTLELAQFTDYEFKFVNGNAWGDDGVAQELVPAACSNGAGGGAANRVLSTTADAFTYSTAYGGCPD